MSAKRGTWLSTFEKILNMFKSILVSTDFSPASWKAFKIGLSLRERYQSELYLLHIFPIEEPEISEDSILKMNKVKRKMEMINSELAGEKHHVTTVILPGQIENELLKFVKEQNFDLVIIGVNGNGEDNLPGSHTTTLLEKSTSPVLVIPNSFSLND